MIVIKIEMWPKGFKERAYELGRMYITNDGTSKDPKRGNYKIKVVKKGTTDKVSREGEVENYPRKSYPVWELVKRAIGSVY